MRPLFAILLLSQVAHAQALPPVVREVDIDEQLGQSIPTALDFTDQNGRAVRLTDYFQDDRPAVVVLAYFRCPMLCDLVLRGLADGLRATGWVPGARFRVLTVSIDPTDTPADALGHQTRLLQAMGHPEAAAGWPFLVGKEPRIRALADALGFRYAFDPKTNQYAHPAAVFVLTSRARISRYLYGVQFSARDLRLSLTEAGQGRVGTIIDRVLLTCYRFDPSSRRYALVVSGVMRGGSALVFLILATMLGLLWRRERARRAA